MKGSSVVQGFKSLAAAIHPQLPLTSRESNRLLNALTGSFRKHLDEVHPPKAVEDGKHTTSNGPNSAPKVNQHATHSSATLADKHLASVLTNPLLARGPHAVKTPEQEYASAKVELQRNPSKDPIILLEEYQERGAATIAIAKLCLTVFNDSIKDLPKDQQRVEILKTQAGRRTLLWLWQTELYKERTFVDDMQLLKLLVAYIMKEGHEKYIWDWIHLDQKLAYDAPPLKAGKYPERKRKLYAYRWKGRLLGALADNLIHGDDRRPHGLNDAMDVYHRAHVITKTAQDYMRYLPLGPAYAAISNALTSSRYDRGGMNLDTERFERFGHELELMIDDSWAASMFAVAKHWLWHPTKPSADLMLSFYRNIQSNMADSWKGAARSVQDPRTPDKKSSYYFTLVQSITLLRHQKRETDANWLESFTKETYPDIAKKYLDKDVLEWTARYQDRSNTPSAKRETDLPPAPERVPFPTFA